MPDSEHIFSNKNDAINELHRLRGVKYRNSRMYTVNKSKIKRLGIELRQEMIDLERKYYV